VGAADVPANLAAAAAPLPIVTFLFVDTLSMLSSSNTPLQPPIKYHTFAYKDTSNLSLNDNVCNVHYVHYTPYNVHKVYTTAVHRTPYITPQTPYIANGVCIVHCTVQHNPYTHCTLTDKRTSCIVQSALPHGVDIDSVRCT